MKNNCIIVHSDYLNDDMAFKSRAIPAAWS